jgi:hypothetical protein
MQRLRVLNLLMLRSWALRVVMQSYASVLVASSTWRIELAYAWLRI